MGDGRLHDLCKERGNAGTVAALLLSDAGLALVPGKHGRLPLHYACQSGDAATVALLLARGGRGGGDVAEPDGREYLGINTKNAFGMTPVYVAAQHGAEGVIKVLAATGACDLAAADAGGLAPLHIAARNNRAGAVRTLLEAGADPSQQDSISRTPRDWARDKRHTQVLQVFDQVIDAVAASSVET